MNRSVSCLLSTAFDGDAIREAAAGCRKKLGKRPDLALVFASSDYRPHLPAVIEHLQIDGHAAMIAGASADGLFGVGHELENACGLSFSLFSLPETTIELFQSNQDFVKCRLLESSPAGFLVLANPLRCGTQGPLREINTDFPGVPTVGGMITGGPEGEDLFLFTREGRVDADFLALGFFGGVKIVPLVSQSCRPIGEPMVVTGSRANVVSSIGGREPFRVLEEAFDSLGESLWEVADGNIFAGLAIYEQVHEFTTGNFLIRPIVGADLRDGRVTLTSPPRVGQTIQFQLRNAAVATSVLREQGAWLKAEHGDPFAAFLCAGRGRGRKLFGEIHHDVSILGELFGTMPLTGFFGNGEFGPVAGASFRHDHCLCGALFYPV